MRGALHWSLFKLSGYGINIIKLNNSNEFLIVWVRWHNFCAKVRSVCFWLSHFWMFGFYPGWPQAHTLLHLSIHTNKLNALDVLQLSFCFFFNETAQRLFHSLTCRSMLFGTLQAALCGNANVHRHIGIATVEWIII